MLPGYRLHLNLGAKGGQGRAGDVVTQIDTGPKPTDEPSHVRRATLILCRLRTKCHIKTGSGHRTTCALALTVKGLHGIPSTNTESDRSFMNRVTERPR